MPKIKSHLIIIPFDIPTQYTLSIPMFISCSFTTFPPPSHWQWQKWINNPTITITTTTKKEHRIHLTSSIWILQFQCWWLWIETMVWSSEAKLRIMAGYWRNTIDQRFRCALLLKIHILYCVTMWGFLCIMNQLQHPQVSCQESQCSRYYTTEDFWRFFTDYNSSVNL